MKMEKIESRILLKKGDEILLSNGRRKINDGCVYEIIDVVDEGNSIVCYKAKRRWTDSFSGKEREELGILKEYYPADIGSESARTYNSFHRENGRALMYRSDVEYDCARPVRERFIDTHEKIKCAIAENEELKGLNKYIPTMEVLYGYKHSFGFFKQRKSYGTVYIWQQCFAGDVFEKYLSRIRNEMIRNQGITEPEKILEEILQVMIQITDCVLAIHTAGFLHLDIKPDNFMVPFYEDGSIDTGNVYLFDIDTLQKCGEENYSCGTYGYAAPELKKHRSGNYSDIYSLGATLYHALMVTNDGKPQVYEDDKYNQIDSLLVSSELIRESLVNSDAKIVGGLLSVLKDCLHKSERKRYESCQDLKDELQALQKTLKTLREAERANHAKLEGKASPRQIMLDLFYRYPLYAGIDPGKGGDLNILVLGNGSYAEEFLDVCLQMGQMKNTHLHVDVRCPGAAAVKGNYLKVRPALADFVKIDGRGHEGKGDLASLTFQNRERFILDIEDGRNQKIVDELFSKENVSYSYVFMTGLEGNGMETETDSDRISQKIAELISDRMETIYQKRFPVVLICGHNQESSRKAALEQKQVIIYSVNQTITIDPELEQMGFNAHICWDQTLNKDLDKCLQDFMNTKYAYESSILLALSVRYKLFSIGIVEPSNSLCAEKYKKQVLDKRRTSNVLFDELIQMEHCRWLIERAVTGWTVPRDEKGELLLEDCVNRGSVKDTHNKTHPCMVFSRPGSSLSRFKKEDWDKKGIPGELDDLDRMSVMLHRCFKKKAEELKGANLMHSGDIHEIDKITRNLPQEVVQAFCEFRFCLQNILHGNVNYTKQYENYETNFKELFSRYADETAVKDVKKRLKMIRELFFPVIEANIYRDYKANDEGFIKMIPFILTYHRVNRLAMAFATGSSTDTFRNVASATVLSPEEIDYMYCYQAESDSEILCESVSRVLSYLEKRKVHTNVKMEIAYIGHDVKRREELNHNLKRLEREVDKKGYHKVNLEPINIIDCTELSDAKTYFLKYLDSSKENGSICVDRSIDNLFPKGKVKSDYEQALEGLDISWFWFDSKKNPCMYDMVGCEGFEYIPQDSFLRIGDIFSLKNAVETSFRFPEYQQEYEKLWEICNGSHNASDKVYTDSVKKWNSFTGGLSKRSGNGRYDLVINERFSIGPRAKTVDYVYYMPYYASRVCEVLVDKFIEFRIAVQDQSGVDSYTGDTCKVTIRSAADNNVKKFFDDIFYHPQYLMEYYEVSVREKRSEKVEGQRQITVSWYQLQATNVELKEEYRNLIKALADQRYIVNLSCDPTDTSKETIDFSFSSVRMKKLLTNAGMLLEIYTYFKILELDYFDDVMMGVEVAWDAESTILNEFDLILVKGFRTFFVECKAVAELDQNYATKIKALDAHFGVNSKAIIIANLYNQNNSYYQEVNGRELKRMKEMRIETVIGRTEIRQVAKKMKEIAMK